MERKAAKMVFGNFPEVVSSSLLVVHTLGNLGVQGEMTGP